MNLSEQEIKNFLDKKNHNIKIEIFDTITSTNDYAKNAVWQKQITENSLITANTQTAGRGRFDRKFFSPAQTGIYMTFVIFPEKDVEDILLVTLTAAVAVVRAIKNLTGITVNIKWVNDIFFNDKKIAGILTETVFNTQINKTESVIIGIGLNINTKIFPEELKNIATSLNVRISRNKFIAEITNNFFDLYNNATNEQIITEYKKYLITNRTVIYYIDGEKFKGKIEGINNNGNLIINSNNKHVILNSGEIFFDE
ncbi:biotin--[acetyl-CoA-carboxylase] ligase [Candidatus Ruminimicrobium bovinum]|uniref:biotin--[acetyl-CoA-carboxylase] ligase n=1 Tax=Candidatus Ruminimicrobium bovinum TaxID=3242779 RepID=UPI0039B93F17